MQFALRIICNRRITETVKERVAGLTNYLFLSDNLSFIPYWKDNECAILELSAKIENPDYSKIRLFQEQKIFLKDVYLMSGSVHILLPLMSCTPLKTPHLLCAVFFKVIMIHSKKPIMK